MKLILKPPAIFRFIAFNALIILALTIYFIKTKTDFGGVEKHTAPLATQDLVKNAVFEHDILLPETFLNEKEMLEALEEVYDNPLRRKRKRRRKKVMNDSNRALEEEDDDGIDNFLEVRKIVSMFAKSQESKVNDPVLEDRYLKNCGNTKTLQEWNIERKKYPDLISVLEKLPKSLNDPRRITLKDAGYEVSKYNKTILDKFNLEISNLGLYKDDEIVEDLIRNMATMPIVHIAQKSKGTQLKLLATFHDGSQAILKPMRFDRNQETKSDHFYFNDFERHTSEIAAFHLDRILGFRRAVPVVGRKISISKEVLSLAEKDLMKTFFISPAGNLCFHGTCKQYCDTAHAVCGTPDSLEASMAALLPSAEGAAEMAKIRNPWRRSYHKRKKAAWETHSDYCRLVRRKPLYGNTRRLADIADMSVLDFLIGNMDRHHYEVYKVFGNDSFILHLDNGRGFGKPHQDVISILGPLYQCCFIHKSTFLRLMELQHTGPSLSTLMFCSLYKDPLNPVLLDKHLDALNRRLEIVLQIIQRCLQKFPMDNVFFE